jgi:rsbT co-antagonist protein RsbR
MHPQSFDDQSSQVARFRQFLSWTIPIVFIFAAAYALAFFIFGDQLVGSTSAVIFGFGCITWVAWSELQRGRSVRAIALFSAGQLISAISVVLLQPSLLPSLILVPLLAVAVALPYVQGKAMGYLIIGCWVVLVIITLLGIFVNLLNSVAPSYTNLLLVGMTAATAALILLLLWQFSSRLNAALITARTSEEALAASNQTLAEKNSQLETKVEEQNKLLELVSTLEVPVIDLSEGILLAPIVGHIDSRRATALTARLLNDANQQRARLVIIDIAGVPLMDTMVAQLLVEMSMALRLLGCQIALCGITAQVAMTLTTLGVMLSGVTTVRSPQEAITWFHREHPGSTQLPLAIVEGNGRISGR